MSAASDPGPVNRVLDHELEERQRRAVDLQLDGRLEAIGRLAAGIAHEINTPSQVVGHALHFLGEGLADLEQLLTLGEQADALLGESSAGRRLLEQIVACRERIDLGFLRAELPQAVARGTAAVGRVAAIVAAMRDFAVPGRSEMALADVNRGLETAAAVACGTYKHVAELELRLDPLPPIHCTIGDLHQVFLDLIANAGQAVEQRGRSADDGRIVVRSRVDGDAVEISVTDNGTGIPDPIRDRIFEPFFTTREVGRGIGQGLAIARNIVVNRHGGRLWFSTEVGRGTTFFVRIPLLQPAASDPALAAGF